MKIYWVAVVVAVLACSLGASAHRDLTEEEKEFEEAFFAAFPRADRDVFHERIHDLMNLNHRARNEETHQVFAAAAPAPFQCPSIPAPADTDNVHTLRPGNIKVIAALGDSLTAAMSAKDTSVFSLKQYRGISYDIGGDSGVITLPNIIKQFSPNLIGASTGVGDETSATANLNVAIVGDINSDIFGQAQTLVQKFKANTAIDFANDWKMLSIWIGSNNLCDVCDDNGKAAVDATDRNDAEGYRFQLNKTLTYLQANVPRLFVNVIANLDIIQLSQFTTFECSLVHAVVCGCVTGSSSDKALTSAQATAYHTAAYAVANYFNAKNYIDFAVVVQPFLVNTRITNRNQISAADCFHPAAASHATAAIALWNNIISPAGQKQTSWDPSATTYNCPTADTLLYTN